MYGENSYEQFLLYQALCKSTKIFQNCIAQEFQYDHMFILLALKWPCKNILLSLLGALYVFIGPKPFIETQTI